MSESTQPPLPPVPPSSSGPGGPPPQQQYSAPAHHSAPAPASSSRLRGCLLVVGLLLLMGSMLVNLLLFVALIADAGPSPMHAAKPYQEELIEGSSEESSKILVLDIAGVITNFSDSQVSPSMVETFRRQLRQGVDDSDVKAILVKINSPGGEVLASDILYHEIKKAREEKPLLVFMETMAASGGFYAAMGSEFIMANELTITGSIGVIVQTMTYQQLGEKIGVQFNTFTSGPNKSMFGGATEITAEQAGIIQNLVEESYTRFVGIVGESRDIPVSDLREKLADGRVLTGQQAFDAKLVDELGYLEDAYAKARDMGKAADAKIVRYRPEISFLELFSIFGEAKVPSKIEVNLTPQIPQIRPGLPYFLAPHILLDQ